MFEHSFRAMVVLLPLAMAVGCGDDAATAEPGVSGTSADGDGDGDGDETWGERGCSYVLGDHSSVCEGPDCAILTDIEITCDDAELGDQGIRVAATHAGAFLVAGGPGNIYMFEAQGDTITRLDDPPHAIVGEHVLVAATPEGEAHLLFDASGARTPGAPSGLLHVWPGPEGWNEELVVDRGQESIVALDFEFAADGTAHAWFYDTAQAVEDHATRTGPDLWSLDDGVEEFIERDVRHFTLTPQGEEARYAYVSESFDWQLQRSFADQTVDFGPQLSAGYYSLSMRAVEPAMPSEGEAGPGDAVVGFDEDGVRLLWPEAESWGSVLIGDTQDPPWDCLPGGDDPCLPDPCHETGHGVRAGDFNVARTADGTIWLVWIETRYDIMMTFYESCTDGICACLSELIEDNSFNVLHLARFDGAGVVEEVLAMEIAAVQGRGLQLGLGGLGDELALAIDARGYGDRLAIGVRQKPSPGLTGLDRSLRLLELDTSQL